MQDDMVVRAKPLVLVIGFIEAMFELLVQGHDMVRLRDWFECGFRSMSPSIPR